MPASFLSSVSHLSASFSSSLSQAICSLKIRPRILIPPLALNPLNLTPCSSDLTASTIRCVSKKNVSFSRWESCLVRSPQAHSLRQQLQNIWKRELFPSKGEGKHVLLDLIMRQCTYPNASKMGEVIGLEDIILAAHRSCNERCL